MLLIWGIETGLVSSSKSDKTGDFGRDMRQLTSMDLGQLEDCANKGSGVVDKTVEHSSCSIELIHLFEQAIYKA